MLRRPNWLLLTLSISPPITGEGGHPAIGAGKAESYQIGMNLFSVRRCLRDFPASAFSQPASLSAKGSSLLGRSGTENVGSIVPALKYFAIVLRDSPVRRLISRIDCFSRRRHPTDEV